MGRDIPRRKDDNRFVMAGSFLQEPLTIFQRVFRLAFVTKDGIAMYFATNEGAGLYNRLSNANRFLPLHDFLMWHNPIEYNTDQVQFLSNRSDDYGLFFSLLESSSLIHDAGAAYQYLGSLRTRP